MSSTRWWMAGWLFVAAPFACSKDDPGTPSASDGGAPALDAQGAAVGPERFVGQWDYSDGQAKLACPAMTALTQDLRGTFLSLTAGAGASPLVLTSPGCNLRFDIQGQTAVVQPGQSCTNPIANRAAKSEPTAFTVMLKEPGALQSSTWTITFADAPNAPCTMTAQGNLLKHK